VGLCEHIRFNKTKKKALDLGWGHPQYQSRPEEEATESSPAKNYLGVLVDERLNMRQ